MTINLEQFQGLNNQFVLFSESSTKKDVSRQLLAELRFDHHGHPDVTFKVEDHGKVLGIGIGNAKAAIRLYNEGKIYE